MSDIKDLSPIVLPPTVPRRRGRPPKALVESKKKRNKVGRPQGDAGRIQEFKARLLSSSGTSNIDINGNSNVLFTEQTDAGVHTLTLNVIGGFNSITTQQQGNNNTDVNLTITGTNNTTTIRTSSTTIVNPMTAVAR